MCQRVLEIYQKEKEALNEVINICSWTKLRKLTSHDHDLLRYYVEFFGIFKEKGDLMGGEDYCNIHLVHSTVKILRRHIAKWSAHTVIGSFVRDFSELFSQYFDFVDHPEHPNYQEIYAITAYLSPYHQAMLSPQEKKSVEAWLMAEVLLREEEAGQEPEVGQAENPADPQTAPPGAAAAADDMIPGK